MAIAISILGCHSNIGPESEQEIPKVYQPFLGGTIAASELNNALARLPYKSICLARYTTRSNRPSYQVTLNRDLSAEYIPLGKLDPNSVIQGEIDAFTFGRLCYLIDQSKIKSFHPEYSSHRPHAEQVTLTITTVDGSIKVTDIGGVGPIELWGLFQAVDSVRQEIQWGQPKGKTHEPSSQKP